MTKPLSEALSPLEQEQAKRLTTALQLLEAMCLADAELYSHYPQWWRDGKFVKGGAELAAETDEGKDIGQFINLCTQFFKHAAAVVSARKKPAPDTQAQIREKFLMMEYYDKITAMQDGQLPSACFTACVQAIEVINLEPDQTKWVQTFKGSDHRGGYTAVTLPTRA